MAATSTSSRRQVDKNPEHRWPVVIVITLALTVYYFLPPLVSWLPSWVIPAVAIVVFIPLILANPRHLSWDTPVTRGIGIGLAFGLAVVNQVYVVELISELVNGRKDGAGVLLVAGGVWITNVVAFSLIYWELDEGGPVARRIEGLKDRRRRDYRFPQQDNPKGVEGWMPVFFDYAYFSLTNMMAFSPTDVMPLSLRGKGFMAYQSLTGFVILALVISRAVNILAPS